MHLENHKGVNRAIEEFQMSLKDAKLSEVKRIPHTRATVLSVAILSLIPLLLSDPDEFTSKTNLFRQTEQTGEAVRGAPGMTALHNHKSCINTLAFPQFSDFFRLLSHFSELLE